MPFTKLCAIYVLDAPNPGQKLQLQSLYRQWVQTRYENAAVPSTRSQLKADVVQKRPAKTKHNYGHGSVGPVRETIPDTH